jgi:ubiquinone/menaquinone biosynthesis C-methylase UbiE
MTSQEMPKDRAQETMDRLLRDAGIRLGMRVLDVGCGHGGVSLMLAHLVGATGSIVAIDRDPAAALFARTRIAELRISNVQVVESDIQALTYLSEFDAVVGRRVLMYVPDRASAMRAVAMALKPGAVAVFQEVDAAMLPKASAPLPLHERVHHWIWRTVEREGATPSMGFELGALFEDAGLVLEEIRAEAIVQTATHRHMTETIVRAILPRIEAAGVATAAEIDIDTLEQRLADELSHARATYIGDMIFSAWARKVL